MISRWSLSPANRPVNFKCLEQQTYIKKPVCNRRKKIRERERQTEAERDRERHTQRHTETQRELELELENHFTRIVV